MSMRETIRMYEDELGAIIEFYGEKHQKRKLSEELYELNMAVRGGIVEDSPEHIAEEIIDVYVMLCQMVLIYDIPFNLLEATTRYKIHRTLYRMSKDEMEKKAEAMAALSEKYEEEKTHGTDKEL